MRVAALALMGALVAGLPGCATMTRVALPAPSPPPIRPAEVVVAVVPPPPPPANVTPSPPLDLPPAPPAPPAPPPVKPPPPVAVAPTPAPPPASPPVAPAPVPAPVAPAPPPPQLAAQVSTEDERRIQGEAQKRIDKAEHLVKQIDQRRLANEQQDNLLTVQSFLAKAREALTERDVQRAMTLADKALLLVNELFRTIR